MSLCIYDKSKPLCLSNSINLQINHGSVKTCPTSLKFIHDLCIVESALMWFYMFKLCASFKGLRSFRKDFSLLSTLPLLINCILWAGMFTHKANWYRFCQSVTKELKVCYFTFSNAHRVAMICKFCKDFSSGV